MADLNLLYIVSYFQRHPLLLRRQQEKAYVADSETSKIRALRVNQRGLQSLPLLLLIPRKSRRVIPATHPAPTFHGIADELAGPCKRQCQKMVPTYKTRQYVLPFMNTQEKQYRISTGMPHDLVLIAGCEAKTDLTAGLGDSLDTVR